MAAETAVPDDVIGVVMPETGDFGSVGTEAVVGAKAPSPSSTPPAASSAGRCGSGGDSGGNANQGILAVQELIDNYDPAFMIPDTIARSPRAPSVDHHRRRIPTASAPSAPDLGNAETFPFPLPGLHQQHAAGQGPSTPGSGPGRQQVGILTSSDAAGVAVADSADDQLHPTTASRSSAPRSFEQARPTSPTAPAPSQRRRRGPDRPRHRPGQRHDHAGDRRPRLGRRRPRPPTPARWPAHLADIIPAGRRIVLHAQRPGPAPGHAKPPASTRPSSPDEGDIKQHLQVPAINHDIMHPGGLGHGGGREHRPDAVKEALDSLDGRPDADLLPALALLPGPQAGARRSTTCATPTSRGVWAPGLGGPTDRRRLRERALHHPAPGAGARQDTR